MKLSLAIALHLAIIATAAPTSLRTRQGEAPSADVTSKIAYGSLKSAAQMMNMYDNEADDSESKNKPDYGNNMPVSMTPNSEMTFPASEGQGSLARNPKDKAKTKLEDIPTPVVKDEKEADEDEEEEAALSSSSSAAVIPAASSPSPSASAAAAASTQEEEEEEDDDTEFKQKKPKAEAEAAPTASPSPPAKKPESPLSGVPVLGTLLGNL
ncbi:hypothetical protein BJX70DRAFT_402591 [Aspergillus crustosus]